MNRQQFETDIKKIYSTVAVITDKPGKKVIRCRHTELLRDVVVKITENDLPACRFLCGIRHANLPEIYDVYELDDGFAVVEEFIAGMDLRESLGAGLYDYSGARSVIRQVCRALAVLHENGFVHRDVKPENVMIADDGTVKLIDFDACRAYSSVKSADTQILGTIGYAPPEQFGVAQSDSRSDIYAVGVLLNVMLTGVHPSESIARGRAGRIIRKCTRINPDERFRDVEKLISAL